MKNKIIFISSYTTLRKFNSFEYNPSNDFFYSFGMAPNIYGDILEKNNCFEIEKPTLPAPHIIIFI